MYPLPGDGTEEHEGGTLCGSADLTRLFWLVGRFCLCEFEETGRQFASRRGFPRLSSVRVKSTAIDSPFECALSSEIADGRSAGGCLRLQRGGIEKLTR